MLAKYPWLRQYGEGAPGHEPSQAAASSASEPRPRGRPAGDTDSDTEKDISAEDTDRLFAELEAARGQAAVRRPEDLVDFTTEVRGGRWTLEHIGVAADSERGKAANAEAASWCRTYGLAMSFSCHYAAYSAEAVSALVLAWAHRMQYLYDVSCREGPLYVFTAADIGKYTETEAFASWAAGQTHRAVLKRIEQIRNIRPEAPVTKRARGD